MEIIKCPNCGAQSFKKEENNTLACNYCGSKIIRKSTENSEGPKTTVPLEHSARHPRPNANFFTEKICPRCGGTIKEDFNTAIFIILLIIFWPFGIAYLFIPKKKKCSKCGYKKLN